MNQTTPGPSSACGSQQETSRVSTVATGAEDLLITAWLMRAPARPRRFLLPHGRCLSSRPRRVVAVALVMSDQPMSARPCSRSRCFHLCVVTRPSTTWNRVSCRNKPNRRIAGVGKPRARRTELMLRLDPEFIQDPRLFDTRTTPHSVRPCPAGSFVQPRLVDRHHAGCGHRTVTAADIRMTQACSGGTSNRVHRDDLVTY